MAGRHLPCGQTQDAENTPGDVGPLFQDGEVVEARPGKAEKLLERLNEVTTNPSGPENRKRAK